MLYKSSEIEKDSIMRTAARMCVAARTAPKGCGTDNLVTAILTDSDKDDLADEMEKIGKKKKIDFFVRDAQCVRQSTAVVLIGTKLSTRGVPYCGFCGFKDCSGKIEHGGVCVYDSADLGIAIGSAASIAADDRVDNRVLFSAGKTAINLNLLGEEVQIVFALPLAAKGKNVFFDRNC